MRRRITLELTGDEIALLRLLCENIREDFATAAEAGELDGTEDFAAATLAVLDRLFDSLDHPEASAVV